MCDVLKHHVVYICLFRTGFSVNPRGQATLVGCPIHLPGSGELHDAPAHKMVEDQSDIKSKQA